jgi:hypothetical protein
MEEDSTLVDAMDIDFDDTNSNSIPLSSLSSSGMYKVLLVHSLGMLQLQSLKRSVQRVRTLHSK